MDTRFETLAFTGQRVVELITKQPDEARQVLEELRQNPNPTNEEYNDFKQIYGEDTACLHQFFVMVIKDTSLCVSIEYSDEVLQAAANDEEHQARQSAYCQSGVKNAINKYSDQYSVKTRITWSNRANEMLAMARILVESQAVKELDADQSA